MKLHHTVDHIPMEEIAKSIELNGLIPQVAEEYKDLVPEEIRHLPVVWLAEGIWQGFDCPVFEVDSASLDKDKLFRTTRERNLGWWIYQGEIPAHLMSRLSTKDGNC